MMTAVFWLGAALLAAWIVLVFFWHGFWRMDVRLAPAPALPPGGKWPDVAIVVPARNEREHLKESLSSLLAQDYAGRFSITLVNDNSTDETGDIARKMAQDSGGLLHAVDAPEKPQGWAGKMAALHHGVMAAREKETPEFFWFTDADITHAPDTLRRLVFLAQSEKLGLASVMVRLHCASLWEKLLVPAFVYFFFLLYPPRAVARPDRYAAGAAGGCLLIRAAALDDIGGIAAIHDAVIDDCALARKVKDRGFRLWLGLSDTSSSLRRYDTLSSLWAMVARSAYAQLGYSPWMLAGALAGVLFTFVLPAFYPPGFVFGAPWAHFPGLVAFGLMTASMLPIVRFYGLGKGWALLLPLAALLYAAMTASSALAHMTGRGVSWRGRDV